MSRKIRIGLIGPGRQMRKHHFPFLQRRQDVSVEWCSGYLGSDKKTVGEYLAKLGMNNLLRKEGDAWKQLLQTHPVDAVLISLPNSLHGEAVRAALEQGVNVAVEKPTTVTYRECLDLVQMADRKGLVFVTLSQRRYEYVYRRVQSFIEKGGLGEPLLVNYMIAHEYFPGDSWTKRRSLAGGGALIASGYHGIDTMLWALRHGAYSAPSFLAKSVSATWVLDSSRAIPDHERIETLANARICFNNDCVFNATASFSAPEGSIDENYKVFGTNGAIRIMRDRFVRRNNSAALLSFQEIGGRFHKVDTKAKSGRETAPLADFLKAVHAWREDRPWAVISPARDSIETIRIIEAAYTSARNDGDVISL